MSKKGLRPLKLIRETRVLRAGDRLAVIPERPLDQANVVEFRKAIVAAWPDLPIVVFSEPVQIVGLATEAETSQGSERHDTPEDQPE